MNVRINASKANGSIMAPPSKSYAHRLIIGALLADGISKLTNVDYSEDIKATIDCAKALNAKITADGSTVTIAGAGRIESSDRIDFMCRESGSTMRFFMGIALGLGCECRFYGSETLRKRPFSVYQKICEEQNILFDIKADHILVCGKLKSGEYEVAGNISSQFITGLLFSLPLLDGDSVLRLTEPIESKSYINITIQALRCFGINIEWEGSNTLIIKGNQTYTASDNEVEGDYSNAAFLEGFNLLGGNVTVNGLNTDSLQGDKAYISFYKALSEGEANIDLSDCPDLGPVLMSIAAARNGAIFTGTERLKIKESNRGLVMCENLSQFGVETHMEENTITVKGGMLKKPEGALSGHNDHRIVMSMALLLSLTGGVIEGAQAVSKSYPGFFEDIKRLGIEVIEE